MQKDKKRHFLVLLTQSAEIIVLKTHLHEIVSQRLEAVPSGYSQIDTEDPLKKFSLLNSAIFCKVLYLGNIHMNRAIILIS